MGTVGLMRGKRTKQAVRHALKKMSVLIEARAAQRELASLPSARYDQLARRLVVLGKRLAPEPLRGEGLPVDEELLAARLRVMQNVDLPFVLAGQVGRSGGTLMLRLFDAHPECLVIPHELGRMLPAKSLPRDPNEAFARLTPKFLGLWHRDGVKIGKPPLSAVEGQPPQPFHLQPTVLRRLFVEAMRNAPPANDRDVLNRYFSAYFAAWTDGPSPAGRSWIVGFEPGAIEKEGRMECFDTNYPDGRVLVTIRDPWSWMVSARAWNVRFEQRDVAMREWLRSTRAAIARKSSRPENTLLLSFEDLVLRTEDTMRRVSAFLSIAFNEVLLAPSLNGIPAESNSSFPDDSTTALSAAPAVHRRTMLSPNDEQWITERAGAMWDEASALIGAT